MNRYLGKMSELRATWGGRCVFAGGERDHGGPLEFAHLPGKKTAVKWRGRGRADRYHDVKRNPGAYVLVCRNHHAEMDGRGGGVGADTRGPRGARFDLPKEAR